MPANRLRNEYWRRSLEQVFERGGGLEISVPRPAARGGDVGALEEAGAGDGPARSDRDGPARLAGDGPARVDGADAICCADLIWRVKMVALNSDEIVVEAPCALGQTISLEPGVELVAVMAIGQNRWMFRTTVLGPLSVPAGRSRTIPALRLKCPETVERCQRRSFYRVSAVELHLPKVACWPLLNPESAIVAEKANEMQVRAAQKHMAPDPPKADSPPADLAGEGVRSVIGRDGRRFGRSRGVGNPPSASRGLCELTLPEVGPRFDATLSNIGGGGIGIIVEAESATALTRHRLFWLRLALPPELPVPLGATARLVHTHIDSSQRTYAGLAFEFGHNRSHQHFVVEQICRCVRLQQESQLRKAG